MTIHHHFRHPIPAFRRASTRLIAFALLLMLLAVIGQLLLLLGAGALALLLCFSSFFTLILSIPLLIQTVLHPEITLTEESLTLHPMLWRAQTISYSTLLKLVRHPMLPDAAAYSNFDRLLWGKHRQPREGIVIVVADAARLNPLYRLVGSLAGVRGAAFAISSTTHRDYPTLRAKLARLIDECAPADYSDSSP